MHLNDHSLRQLDEAYLASLDAEALRGLSVRLLADLKEARERLNQTPDNSSRPPSSRAPWERAGDEGCDEPDTEVAEPDGAEPAAAEPPSGETSPSEPEPPAPPANRAQRRAGKQPGAPGRGRTQVFHAHETIAHYPSHCAGCAHALDERVSASAYTGFQALDVQWGDKQRAGLTVRVVDHRYYEVPCRCGHHTRAVAGSGDVDALFNAIELSEWRVVGAGLAALIVALSRKAGPLRFRLSRARIREFLHDWLGIELSTGTIHRTLHEAAAALAPAEDELVRAVLDSDLLHADETPWPQHDRTLWLWRSAARVFTAAQVTLYYIAGRGKELAVRRAVENVLDGFTGWLMSDGWGAYRHYGKRLRCWAHLLRKARGVSESVEREAQAFGREVLDTLDSLIKAVYAAREGPPADLSTTHAARLEALRQVCEHHRDHAHAKTRALAVELLNDWEAIFQVLHTPAHPLTNNVAERSLRHWVINGPPRGRKLSHGTRTDTGSRVFALLASVIDTCRQRGHSPWPYLTTAIADRRAGRPLASLPKAGE